MSPHSGRWWAPPRVCGRRASLYARLRAIGRRLPSIVGRKVGMRIERGVVVGDGRRGDGSGSARSTRRCCWERRSGVHGRRLGRAIVGTGCTARGRRQVRRAGEPFARLVVAPRAVPSLAHSGLDELIEIDCVRERGRQMVVCRPLVVVLVVLVVVVVVVVVLLLVLVVLMRMMVVSVSGRRPRRITTCVSEEGL
jgi:hypothetical protein